jgi:ferritin-like protein
LEQWPARVVTCGVSSEGYHEPVELLSEATKERHRAIVSLIEELDAIDWYQQRAEACVDAELRGVLLHHMEEEVEHAMMNLEWLRRNDAVFREKIGIYIGSEGPIVEVEAAEEAATIGAAKGGPSAAPRAASGSLGIGSLKGA